MIFIGDIHGNLTEMLKSIIYFHSQGQINFIQVGDFGVGFNIDRNDSVYSYTKKYINPKLEKMGVMLYVLRGNHDNPDFFKLEEENWDMSNVKFVPDYTILNIEDKNLLFIGGGISLDRSHRTSGKSYWITEPIKIDLEFFKNNKPKDIDVIVTHSAPFYFNPNGFNKFVESWLAVDKFLYDDLTNERVGLNSIADIFFNCKEKEFTWIYGHFHISVETTVNNVKAFGLNVYEPFKLN